MAAHLLWHFSLCVRMHNFPLFGAFFPHFFHYFEDLSRFVCLGEAQPHGDMINKILIRLWWWWFSLLWCFVDAIRATLAWAFFLRLLLVLHHKAVVWSFSLVTHRFQSYNFCWDRQVWFLEIKCSQFGDMLWLVLLSLLLCLHHQLIPWPNCSWQGHF